MNFGGVCIFLLQALQRWTAQPMQGGFSSCFFWLPSVPMKNICIKPACCLVAWLAGWPGSWLAPPGCLLAGWAAGPRWAFSEYAPPMRRTVPCDAAAAYSFQTGSSKILANLQLKKWYAPRYAPYIYIYIYIYIYAISSPFFLICARLCAVYIYIYMYIYCI